MRSIELRIVKRDNATIADLLNASFRFSFGLDRNAVRIKEPVYQETHSDGIIFHFCPPCQNSDEPPVRHLSMPVKWIRIDSTLCGVTCGRQSLDIE